MPGSSFRVSLAVLLSALLAVTALALRPAPKIISHDLERLPLEVDGYSGTNDSFDPEVVRVLNADISIHRHYRSPKGERVDLYVGYYGTAKGGRSGHHPLACLPGAGWGIIDAAKIELRPPGFSSAVTVNRLTAAKNDECQILVTWYQSGGNRVADNGFKQNLLRFAGKIVRNRNDGAFVQVSTLSRRNAPAEAEARVKRFAETTTALLARFWPVEE
jgi:EpsI family protein